MRGQGSQPDEGAWWTDLARELAEGAPVQSRYMVHREISGDAGDSFQEVWDADLRRYLVRRLARRAGDEQRRPDQDAAARVMVREALILGRLEHPGIVPLHELSVEEDGSIFATLKRIEGPSLASILDRAARNAAGWNPTRVIPLILRVCEAVAFAHGQGVIHGRLDPTQVTVGRFGEVFVLDWGWAHAPFLQYLQLETGSVEHEGRVRSTRCWAYTSPNVLQEECAVDPTNDVYSIGAMLYHLLTGAPPYCDEIGEPIGLDRIRRRLAAGPPPNLVGRTKNAAPPELVAVCAKAMAREAGHRYSTVLELLDDLRGHMENRVVKAHRVGAVAELRKWVRRNRLLAATIATAFFVVLTTGFLSIMFAMTSASDERRAAMFRLEEEEALGLSERRTRDLLALSASHELTELVDRAEELWPPDPASSREYDRWLLEAKELMTRLGPLRARRGKLKAEGRVADETAGGAGLGDQTSSSLENRWWLSRLDGLIADLEAFSDGEQGLFTGTSGEWGWGIERRVEFAHELEEQSLAGDEAKVLWEEAIASIRDVDECPMYGGLQLEPQLGLVPVGRDRSSGLWEFAHLQSGDPPVRDEDGGDLALQAESGIVLVLIPGGTFWMGAQRDDPTGHNYDPQARGDELPVHEVSLPAFFISKYEMTQAQWERFTTENPSSIAGEPSRLYPVESVPWYEATRIMRRLGLALPTEEQWEYAARAGTETPWWTGAARESLFGAANLADRSGKDSGHLQPEFDDWPEFRDGFSQHAPVDELLPNRFGLHHVAGNMYEWASTPYLAYGFEYPDWTMTVRVPGAFQRVIRGGGFASTSAQVRSAARLATSENASPAIGVRPARGIGG